MKKVHQRKLFQIIQLYTRRAYLVESDTRAEIVHLVDMEGDGEDKAVCTCESFILGHARPCKHIKNVMMFL